MTHPTPEAPSDGLIERAVEDMRDIAEIDRIGGAAPCVRRAEGFEALLAHYAALEAENGRMRAALTDARGGIVALYSAIASGDHEAGERFASADPVVQQIDTALTGETGT